MKNGRGAELFRGKWTLVTGASSGIGVELARTVAAWGGNVALAARSVDKMEALAADLRGEHGVEARVFGADLAAAGGAGDLARRVEEAGLVIEHLVNNAGVGTIGAFAESDLDAELRMLRLNCEAVVELTHRYLPRMVARGSGGVIQLGSVVSFLPVPYMAVYGASKAFVRSFTEAVAEELAGTGVRMTAVCPGHVPTGFQTAAGFAEEAQAAPGALSAEKTAQLGLEGYIRRETVVVTGVVNRINVAATGVVPRKIVARVGAKMMRKFGRFA